MDTINITFEDGSKKEYKRGVKFSDIVKDVKGRYDSDIISGSFRNQYIGYDDVLNRSGNIILYDINTKQGNKIYERGLIFLFLASAHEVLGENTSIKVKYSIDHGIYMQIDKKLTEEDLTNIKTTMKDNVSKSLPFIKIETTRLEAIDYYKSKKREDKVKTLFYSASSIVTLYKFDGTYNYVMGDLPYDSSCLKYFDLSLIENKGIVLRFPSIYDNKKVVKYRHHENYFKSLEEYNLWGEMHNINTLGDLNELIVNNKSGEIINLSEIVQDYKLMSIVKNLCLDKNIKIILISGPSSSGKTTTAKKLSLYLQASGLNPYHLSLDDYFHERKDTPLDENGNYDFESLRAIDKKLFDSQVAKLLKGTKVVTPTFNFKTGKKEYNRELQLKDNDILIVEGLHALNDEILSNIPRKNKYKIYVSPLAYLTIDDDNRINMTDLRLLRRIVRDNRTRGYNPSHTLNNWSDVRKGEERYVFPFQDQADVVFNSSLIYELGVLKTYVEPLLFSVKEDDPEYETAVRLIQLLKFVLPIASDDVPKMSILREFIGGSYFE